MDETIHITRALTIHQPYAQLIAIGAKQYETRGWTCKFRGWVAIHAGASSESLKWLVYSTGPRREEIVKALTEVKGFAGAKQLSAIVAVAELTAILRAEDIRAMPETSARELLLGDYSDGRYGWKFENVCLLDKPFPAKGAQGLWKVNLTAHRDGDRYVIVPYMWGNEA